MSDGGGGLSTIWGFGLIKREKKPGHIYSDSCLYLLIGFDLSSLIGGEAGEECRNAIRSIEEPLCSSQAACLMRDGMPYPIRG
jgi:hypothetical protein